MLVGHWNYAYRIISVDWTSKQYYKADHYFYAYRLLTTFLLVTNSKLVEGDSFSIVSVGMLNHFSLHDIISVHPTNFKFG